ncbi:hypothetical protein acdb102_25330 [Acidothermaceae bacterium B102]|nr:hypothetical protein acdb102_25330 [Acidothermaceae bacterium B102]
MSVARRPGLAALAVTGSLLLLVSSPATAFAADHHGSGPHARSSHFALNGLVVSQQGTTAVVLARTFADRTGVQHNVNVSVTVGAKQGHSRSHHATALVVGDQVQMTGTETGSGDNEDLTANHVSQHELRAHVFVGAITAINGSVITVAKAANPSDDQGACDHPGRGFGVDVSQASVLVDGAAGALAVGQSVAVLGTGYHDAIVASAVYAFTTAPAVVAGEIKAITGTQVTVDGRRDSSTVIDLATTPLIVNGNVGGDVSMLSEGTKLLTLGTSSNGVFTPTLAFAFNGGDRHPVGGNESEG